MIGPGEIGDCLEDALDHEWYDSSPRMTQFVIPLDIGEVGWFLV
jgi:hypothetical protein